MAIVKCNICDGEKRTMERDPVRGAHDWITCESCEGTGVMDDGEPEPTSDPVNHPAHCTGGDIECIDAIQAMETPEQFIGFLRGQVIRYQWRLGRKDNAKQDAEKARWYADKLVEFLGSHG